MHRGLWKIVRCPAAGGVLRRLYQSLSGCARLILAAAGAIAFVPSTTAAGTVYAASVGYRDGVYSVEVDALVAMPEARVREQLTDYNHLGRVNPAIEVSEVLLVRKPGDYRVRTETEACVWFYCMRVHQVQDVIEGPDGTVTATVLPQYSDFKHGYARLTLWATPAGTRVLIRSEVEPDFWIPPIIGPWLIKRKLRSEALETVQNLERLASPAALPHNSAAQN
jgi:hypothetical protein